jgi:hypothetical protein
VAHWDSLGGDYGLVWGHRVLATIYDQTGYWAIRIVTGVPDALPFVGPILVGLPVSWPYLGTAALRYCPVYAVDAGYDEDIS